MTYRATLLCLFGLSTAAHVLFATDLTGDNLLIGGDNNISWANESAKSAIMGLGNNINGIETLVLGEGNEMSYATANLILGYSNLQVSNTASDMVLCAGYSNTIGESSATLIVGSLNYASVSSGLVAGLNNFVEGDEQFAFGRGLINHVSNSNTSLYFGRYNVSDQSSAPPLLVIGNGTDATHPSNALEVYYDGKIKAYNSLESYAPFYDSANPNSGKIVIMPSITGSSITVDGQPLVTSTSTTAQSFTAPSYSFNSGSTNRLTIDSSGNIGIGTTSPTSALTLSQSTSATGGISWGGDTNLYRQSAGSLVLNSNSGSGTTAQGLVIKNNAIIGTGNYELQLRGYQGDDAGSIYIRKGGLNQNAFYSYGGTGSSVGHTFYTGGAPSSAQTLRFRINDNGVTATSPFVSETTTTLAALGGNVGVGTTNPSVKLDLLAGRVNINVSGNQVPLQTFSKTPALQIVGGGNENSPATIGLLQTSVGVGNQIQGNTGIDLVGTRSVLSSINVRSAVANNDVVGAIRYVGDDGYNLRTFGAYIAGVVNTSVQPVSTGVVPMELQLVTRYQAPITFCTNSYEWMRIDPSGNVGIGTKTPAAKLDVNGDAKFIGSINLFASNYNIASPNNGKIVIQPSTTGSSITIDGQPLVTSTSTSVQSFTAPSYSFNSGGTNRLTIDSSGNIGIGTSSPSAKLDISGNLNVGAAAASTLFVNSSTGETNFGSAVSIAGNQNGGAYIKLTSSSTGGTTPLTYAASADSFIRVYNLASGGNFDRYLDIVANTQSNGSTSSNIRFLTSQNSGAPSEKMRITAAGNVGIGTAIPNDKLDIFYGNLRLSADNAGPNTKLQSINFVRSNYDPTGIAASIDFRRAGGAAEGILAFSTNPGSTGGQIPSERMRITSMGNVGIGTTTPAAKLDVNGDAKFIGPINLFASNYDSGNPNSGKIVIQPSTTGSSITIDGQPLVTSTSTSVQSFTAPSYSFNSGGTNRMTIDSSGNVGVGTNTPYFGLDVYSGHVVFKNTTSQTDQGGDAKNMGLGWASSGQTNVISNLITVDRNGNYGGDFKFYSRGPDGGTMPAALMTLTAYGNLGVGATDPESLFVVRKDASGGRGGELSIVNRGANAFGNEAALNFGVDNSTYGGDNGNAQIKAVNTNASNQATDLVTSIWSGSSFLERMRLTAAGNVGIGTTTPQAKLDVNGSVRFGDARFDVSEDADAFLVYNGADGAPQLRVDGDQKMILLQETGGFGRVGIGTASPQALLDVHGDAVLGMGLTANQSTPNTGQVIVGKYNDTRTSDTSTTPTATNHTQGVFIVAAGTSTTGANAIRVLDDGTVLVKNSGDIGMGSFTNGPKP